jgi:hypothetical protein
MSSTVHERRDTRANQAPDCRIDGGRPVHPAVVATEALVEALGAIDCVYERREHTARALAALANQEHAEAKRLRMVVRPEILEGYRAAETLVAAKIPLRVVRAHERSR